MLNELSFLKPVISSKSLIPIYDHIRIENRCAIASGSGIAMMTPVDTDIVATPRGDELLAALKSSGDKFQMSLLDNGNIVVKAGKFKATVRCSTEFYPEIPTGGRNVELPPLLPALKVSRKFTAANTVRPWSGTTLIRGQSVYSTNNGMLIQIWLDSDPGIDIGIPIEVVDIMLKIGIEPSYAIVDKTWVKLIYDDRWLWFTLCEDKWPSNIERFLSGNWCEGFQDIPVGLYDHLDSIAPFVNAGKDCFIRKSHLSSHIETVEGASVEMQDISSEVSLEIKLHSLQTLENIATSIKFEAPIKFLGNGLRGTVYAEVR